jgi:hypothetical protein
MITNLAIFILVCCTPLYLSAQILRKENVVVPEKGVAARYSWSVYDRYHGATVILTLYTNGRYKYYESFPLGTIDSSKGIYSILKNKLILNSDFQKDGVKIKLRYVDTLNQAPIEISPYPVNLNNEACYNCSYLLNKDSTPYFPIDILNGQRLPVISYLKVNFYGNDFSSEWVPVENPGKLFQVILQTDINFDEYRNKVMKNYIYRMRKGKSILLRKKTPLNRAK